MKGHSTQELLSTAESDALRALRRSGCPEAALVQAWDPASVGRASGPIPLPAQGIQLQLTILEMGKYIDRQMYVLSNSPEGQQSRGDTQLRASSHFGSFSSSRTNRSHKGTTQGNTSFQPSKCLLSREIKWALFKYSQHFLPWK